MEQYSSLIWLSAGVMTAAAMVVFLHGGLTTIKK